MQNKTRMACTDPFSIWLCLDDYTCQMILWSLPFRLPVTNDNKKKKMNISTQNYYWRDWITTITFPYNLNTTYEHIFFEMSLIRETLNEKKEMYKTTWMISLHLRWSFCVLYVECFRIWLYTNFKQTLPPTKFLKCLRAFLNGLLWAAEKSPTGEVAGSPVISRFLLSTSSKVLRREGERRVGEGVEGSCKPKKNKFS